MSSSGVETGPRRIPVPWDPSFYVIEGLDVVGDMLKSEYATNGGYGVVDKALSAYYVTWEGITDLPAAFPPLPHAASHRQGGNDEIGLAGFMQAGLMSQGDANPRSYYGGDNLLHDITTAATVWWSGSGPPSPIPGSKPGDFYLDTASGDVYELS